MLPYHVLQLAYALFAGGLTVCLWRASARFVRSKSLIGRFALVLVLLVAAAAASAWGMQLFHVSFSSRFPIVALLFYAGALWLPMILARALVRGEARSRSERVVLATFAIAAPLIALDALLVEPNRLQIREERVPIHAWPAGTKPLRVAHLSDLQTVGPCDRETRAIEEVRRMHPDLIVFTGDYVAGPFFDTGPAEADARAFLAEMAKIAPTVVVAGHSEGDDVRERVFRGLGLLYLEDEAHEFDFGDGRRVRVVGLDPFKPWLDLVSEKHEPGQALLVATHPPDVTTRLDGRGVDLHLAGHTHGGQIVIPFFGPPITLTRLPREYARGLFRMGDHWMNVCAGLGMEGNHAPRVRLFCPPEICLLLLEGDAVKPLAGTR